MDPGMKRKALDIQSCLWRSLKCKPYDEAAEWMQPVSSVVFEDVAAELL
ncbi:unnamed protein product [Amoebophrya sp. A25]|nr:unnamed protein product [Amoebophrya sp. A25]|eukprot:GSA25T00019655001.1